MNEELIRAEYGISDCERYNECNTSSGYGLQLSSIDPGDSRRGSRDPRILLVTEAPDKSSMEGTAYQGGISNRIRSIFTDPKYGIGLDEHGDSFETFLQKYRIYATSAIKCFIGEESNLSEISITNCKDKFLDKQISAMNNLELIIPMGKIATASVLGRTTSSLTLTEELGRRGRGILTEKHGRDPPIVVFPHPSGANPLSNPPIVSDEETKVSIEKKVKFRNALKEVNRILDDAGYDVLDGEPDCWDFDGGLSSFI